MGKQDKRAYWHNYRSRAIYMVTMTKSHGTPLFGKIAGDCRIPQGQQGHPYVKWSEIGSIVADTIFNIHKICDKIKLLQYIVMPDHLHALLFVTQPTADPFGYYMARFKNEVNNRCGATGIFEKGFNDQILKPNRKLDDIYQYIKQNPYRLAVRQQHPEFFQRIRNLSINGRVCHAYGNPFLLRNPFKEQVVVHRADNTDTRRMNHDQWIHTAANGGILVSPFISEAEKAIRDEAELVGGRFILLHDHPFEAKEKPSRREFNLCAEGRMLMIAPADYSGRTRDQRLSRRDCLDLNALAAAIATNPQLK